MPTLRTLPQVIAKVVLEPLSVPSGVPMKYDFGLSGSNINENKTKKSKRKVRFLQE